MIKKYTPGMKVLDNWTLTRPLGEGNFGRVFEAERVDYDRVYRAAIKIISIPKSQEEVKKAQQRGMDYFSISDFFRNMVKGLVQEIANISRLKGAANIVNYESYEVIEHKGCIGWDIIIRMDLLTPLLNYLNNRQYKAQTIIKLGIDICRALETCHKHNIIHRDIKPENIFVSSRGDFMLGDFGLAIKLERPRSGPTKASTNPYIAPEVEWGSAYSPNVDMYSLGILMYRFLNNHRTPFLPNPPHPISQSDRERAQHMRLSGTKMQPPMYADRRLSEVVLKACAFDPRDRYQNPAQMRQELEAVLHRHTVAPQRHTAPQVNPYINANQTSGVAKTSYGNGMWAARSNTPMYTPPGEKKRGLMFAAVLLPVAALIFVIFLLTGNNNQGSYAREPDTDLQPPYQNDTYANQPPEYMPEPTPEATPTITIRGVDYYITLPTINIIGVSLTNDDIAPIRYMTNLDTLYLIGESNITDLSPISDLTSLTFIVLGHGNDFRDLTPLSNLTNVYRLYLNRNNVHDITPLSNLTNLTRLCLQNNYISDISPIANFAYLESLDLSNNQIRDITPLANLDRLTFVDLSDNPVEDWSPVAHVYYVRGRP